MCCVQQIVFIGASLATLYLMYMKFKATYDRNHDTFRIEFLLIPVTLLGLLVNHEFTPLEVSHASSGATVVLNRLVTPFCAAGVVDVLHISGIGGHFAATLLSVEDGRSRDHNISLSDGFGLIPGTVSH
jgi:hypothetical protein